MEKHGLHVSIIGVGIGGLAACRRERSRDLGSCYVSAHVIHGTRRSEGMEGDHRQNSVGDDAPSGLEACRHSRVRPRIRYGSASDWPSATEGVIGRKVGGHSARNTSLSLPPSHGVGIHLAKEARNETVCDLLNPKKSSCSVSNQQFCTLPPLLSFV